MENKHYTETRTIQIMTERKLSRNINKINGNLEIQNFVYRQVELKSIIFCTALFIIFPLYYLSIYEDKDLMSATKLFKAISLHVEKI